MPEPFLVAIIRWGSAGPLALTSLVVMGSPGPATISLTAAGSAYGVRRSVGYLIGIIVGTTIVLVAVSIGITATLLTVPALRSVLIASSISYILWLAYHVATAPPLKAQTATSSLPSLAGGALLGVANPKAWVAIAAVFTSTSVADGAAADATAKLALLTVMIAIICTTWLIVGASLAPLFRNPRQARAINIMLAVALVASTAFAVLH